MTVVLLLQVGLCLSQSQFSDLLGKGHVSKAEKQRVIEDAQVASKENEVQDKVEEEFYQDQGGFLGLFGGRARSLDTSEVFISPSREAMGFGKRPMSFMTNFKTDVQFDNLKSRVKRSRLDLSPFDLAAAASAQRPTGPITPGLISNMFHRQLMLAEDHGLPVHDAVPGHQAPGPAHHAPVAMAHHPMPAHLRLRPAHQAHHAPVHHEIPQPHHAVTHHTPFKGYPPPKHGGGSLEDIFGLHNGKYVAPVTPVYHPEPEYHAPVQQQAYHEPAVAAHHVDPHYSEPLKGHPFSMEMIFGLPMHGYYMKKYRHMLPFHTPEPEYHAPPEPKYHTPEPEYHATSRAAIA